MVKSKVGKTKGGQRFFDWLKSFGGRMSLNESNPPKLMSRKDRKKRNTKQEIRGESRRKNRPVKNNKPVPKPRKRRYL